MKSTNNEAVSETTTEDLAATNVVLSTLLANLPIGVLIEDSTREIIAANPALCDVFGLKIDPTTLIGRNCARTAEELQDEFVDPERFLARIEAVLDRRESVSDEELRLADGRTLERTYVPYTLPDGEANLWLYRDVTGRKNTERELERQNEQLEEFLSVVSHDLRNPLNVAAGTLEVAVDASDGDHLETAAAALDRMDALIDDLLVLAREEEAINVTEPVHLSDVARTCWSHVETAEATLDVDIDRTVRADRSRLSQVFENLFRNAAEHGGRDVEVTVGTVRDGFYVEDNGRGIPADERDRIFDSAYSTSTNGTGLGLQIAETVVHAHDWDLELAATRGGGARFEITDVQFLD